MLYFMLMMLYREGVKNMTKVNLTDKKTRMLISELKNEILELIDYREEFTRSDLQGGVQALVTKILTLGYEMGRDKSKA